MEDWILGIPTPVAMALIALIGYFLGKRNQRPASVEQAFARRELKRAKAVVKQLEDISRGTPQSCHPSIEHYPFQRSYPANEFRREPIWRILANIV